MSGEEIFRTLYFYASNPSTRCRDQKNPLGPRQFFHKKQTTPLKTYMTMEKKTTIYLWRCISYWKHPDFPCKRHVSLLDPGNQSCKTGAVSPSWMLQKRLKAGALFKAWEEGNFWPWNPEQCYHKDSNKHGGIIWSIIKGVWPPSQDSSGKWFPAKIWKKSWWGLESWNGAISKVHYQPNLVKSIIHESYGFGRPTGEGFCNSNVWRNIFRDW